MSNPWLIHVTQYKKDHPNMIYKDVLREAKKTYVPVSGSKKQKGGNPALAAAISGGVQALSGLGGTIADAVDKGRDDRRAYNKATGWNAREIARNQRGTYQDALQAYQDLLWRRDSALMKSKKIPKELTNKQLKHISGLDKFL